MQISVATVLGVLVGWMFGWSTISGLVFGMAISVARPGTPAGVRPARLAPRMPGIGLTTEPSEATVRSTRRPPYPTESLISAPPADAGSSCSASR